MISRGVEISIAGGGGEMVRDPIAWWFFLFFCNPAFIDFKVQKASCSASYGENKTYKSNHKQKKLWHQ